MRKLSTFLTAIIIFVCVGVSAQEPKPFFDTVKINCENRVLIRIAVYDQADLKKDTSIQSLILELQKNLGKINNNLPEGSYKVVYRPDQSLVIEQLTTISRFTLSGDTIAPFLLNNECEVVTEKYKLTFRFAVLNDLMNSEMSNCIASVIKQLPDKNRYAWVYNYSTVNGMASESAPPLKSGYTWDMLNLSAGIGTGLIRSTLVTDIGLEVGFNFNKKGILRNGYYTSGNLLYIFDNPAGDFHLNAFLNLGYRYNLSNDKDKTNWLGPEIGFLIHKEGDFFKSNVIRAGVRWELGKSVFVTGQLYIEDKFKSAYPGIRIGFWF